MKKEIGLCKNCGHKICMVKHEKGVVNKLFNGKICHSNGRKKWACICRVGRCGCMNPEIDKGELK